MKGAVERLNGRHHSMYVLLSHENAKRGRSAGATGMLRMASLMSFLII
jgi:hypothetical protein